MGASEHHAVGRVFGAGDLGGTAEFGIDPGTNQSWCKCQFGIQNCAGKPSGRGMEFATKITMRILVLFATSGEKVGEFEMQPSTSVFSLHCKVAALTDVPVAKVRLLRGAEVLPRSVSLEQAGVEDGENLELVVASTAVCIWGNYDFVKVCCAKTGEEVQTLQGRDPEFTNDGSMVLLQRALDTVTIWNARTWTCLQTIRVNGIIVLKRFSLDGSLVATSGKFDKILQIWNSSTGLCLQTFALEDFCWGADEVLFSPDGSMVCVGSGGILGMKNFVIFNIGTCASVNIVHDSSKYAVFPPTSTSVCTSGSDESKIWNPNTGECLHSLAGGQAVFSPDGSKLLSVTDISAATIWDASTFEPLLRLGQSQQPSVPSDSFTPEHGVLRASFSADGALVVGNFAPSDDPERGLNLMVWNASTGDFVRTLTKPLREPKWTFSKDGSLVLTMSPGNQAFRDPEHAIGIWDLETGHCIVEFEVEGYGALLF